MKMVLFALLTACKCQPSHVGYNHILLIYPSMHRILVEFAFKHNTFGIRGEYVLSA